MLITKWGKALDKNHPLCEYPRPQFVRDSYISLNGMWKCAFYNKLDCEDEKIFAFLFHPKHIFPVYIEL